MTDDQRKDVTAILAELMNQASKNDVLFYNIDLKKETESVCQDQNMYTVHTGRFEVTLSITMCPSYD